MYSSVQLAGSDEKYFCVKQKDCRSGDILIIETNKIGAGKFYLAEKIAKYCDFDKAILRNDIDDKKVKVVCVYRGSGRVERKPFKGKVTD